MPARKAPAAGVVVIGRNEGDRLTRCLNSLLELRRSLVYIDSGSTDGSVARVREAGFFVVELDRDTHFTAARARNVGFQKLSMNIRTSTMYSSSTGDCEVVPSWIQKSVDFLENHPDVAVAFGLRRERFPNRSVYNLIIDLEWQDLPAGEAMICGGDALVRVSAFQQVGGFRSDLICGEEPELCVRLRQSGWRIWRLPENMTLHDAALLRFSQWWTRSKRSGFAYAMGAHLHGAGPDRHWVVEYRRIWMWGLWIPAAIVLLACLVRWEFLVLFLVYPLQVVRLALRGKRSRRENWIRAVALVVGQDSRDDRAVEVSERSALTGEDAPD